MRGMALGLFVATVAATTAAASSVATLRVINTVTTPATVSAAGLASGQPVVVGPGDFDGDIAVENFHQVVVQVDGQNLTAPVPVGLGSVVSSYTVMVYEDAAAAAALSSFLDLEGPVESDGIDIARIRVLNANIGAGQDVTLFGMTTDCYECHLLQISASVPCPGASSDPASSTSSATPSYVSREQLETVGQAVATAFAKGTGSGAVSFLASDQGPPRPQPPAAVLGQYIAFDAAQDYNFELRKADGESVFHSKEDRGRHGVREKGVYTLVYTPSGGSIWIVEQEGNNTWLPLIYAAAGLLIGGIALRVALYFGRRCMESSESKLDDVDGSGPTVVAGRDYGAVLSSKKRVEAIDAFRGICLSIMIFVNYGGGGYWWLDHSSWNGLTVADLVFPMFVWTMGASMALSMYSQRRKGIRKVHITAKSVLRAVKLFAVGLFLNGGMDLSNWRIPGVLQYFAIGGLVVGLIAVYVPVSHAEAMGGPVELYPEVEGSAEASAGSQGGGAQSGPGSRYGASTAAAQPWGFRDADLASVNAHGLGESLLGSVASPEPAQRRQPQRRRGGDGSCSGCRPICGDLLPFWLQWLVILALVGVYFGLQFGLPVKGCPTGYIGPGGLANGASHPECTGGAHRLVDVSIFGTHHIYHNLNFDEQPVSAATCAYPYGCEVYDPEGTLGYVSAILMTFLGLQAGRILLSWQPKRGPRSMEGDEPATSKRSTSQVFWRWALWGVILGAIGTGLCGASKEGGVLPLNKNLWSPSFVLTLAGVSFCCVALLYLLIDVAGGWDGAPFTYLGKNSIVIYAGSEIFQYYFPFTIVDYPGDPGIFRDHSSALVANFIGVLCWMGIAYYLFSKGIFVKL